MRHFWLLPLLALCFSGCGAWLAGNSRPLHGPSPQDFVPTSRTAQSTPELTPGQRYRLQATEPAREITGTVAQVTAQQVVLRDADQQTESEMGVPRDDTLLGQRQFRAVGAVHDQQHFAELIVPRAEITAVAAAEPREE